MAFEDLLVAEPLSEQGRRIEVGRIAEDLLFYESVRVHVSCSELVELLAGVGVDTAIELMERGNLKLAYANNFVCARTHKDGVIALYEPLIITADKFALESAVDAIMREIGQTGPGTAKLVTRLVDLIEERPHDVGICDATRTFLDNSQACEDAVRAVLDAEGGLPEGHPPLRFRPTRHEGGRFTVDTNIDFDLVNAESERIRGPLDPARLIAFVASAYSKLSLAGQHSADLDTNAVDSILLGAQIRDCLSRRNRAEGSFYELQRVAFGNGNAIAEAINAHGRSFQELTAVLEKAQGFRKWLRSQPPQVDLVHQFYVESTADTWISRLPAKTFRWLAATAAGGALAGTPGLIAGAAVGAIDTFLVDRILGGWKPSHFVNGALKQFAFTPSSSQSG